MHNYKREVFQFCPREVGGTGEGTMWMDLSLGNVYLHNYHKLEIRGFKYFLKKERTEGVKRQSMVPY